MLITFAENINNPLRKKTTGGRVKVLILALLVSFALLFSGCVSSPQQPAQGAPPAGQQQAAKLKVVASFYPMYDFAKNVGGERADVAVLIPPGVEPHSFEPSPSDIRQLSEADMFILNGAGLEHSWAHGLIDGVGNQKLVVVEASKGVELIHAEEHEGEEEHEAEEGHHDHGEYDPHVWVSPANARKQVDEMKNAFIAADPEGRAYYEANAASYGAKLDALDTAFRALLPTCKKKDILITHASLGYFCREYGCRQIPIEGVNAEGEPSPSELASIVDQARAQNVTAVYFESLISPKSAQTLASEIGAQALVFNTVNGVTLEDEAKGMNYLTLMEENLASIKKGLDCG